MKVTKALEDEVIARLRICTHSRGNLKRKFAEKNIQTSVFCNVWNFLQLHETLPIANHSNSSNMKIPNIWDFLQLRLRICIKIFL